MKYENTMRSVTLELLKATPKVGKLAAFVVGSFWTKDNGDIWSSLEDRMQKMIDAAVLAAEKKALSDMTENVRLALQSYSDNSETSPSAAATWLITSINNCRLMNIHISNSKNKIHLAGQMLTLSYLHLTALREQTMFQKELFNKAESDKLYANELDTYIAGYKMFFLDCVTPLKTWRQEQISNKQTSSGGIVRDQKVTITDHLTNQTIVFTESNSTVSNIYQRQIAGAKERIVNDWYAELMKIYQLTFSLGNFKPGHENDAPVVDAKVNSYMAGPYAIGFMSGHSTGSKYMQALVPVTPVTRGNITEVKMWLSDLMRGMQVKFANREAPFVGTKNGATEKTFSLLGKKNIREVFTVWGLDLLNGIFFIENTPPEYFTVKNPITKKETTMQIPLIKQQETNLFYDRKEDSRETYEINAGGVDQFRLVNITYGRGSNINGHEGIAQIKFEFLHESVVI